MVGRTARIVRLVATLAGAGLAAAGCASLTDPFLGVPEWQTVRYGEADAESSLKGVPKITAVETREYMHYVRAASAGRIVAREIRGDWVYYALATRRVMGVSGQGQGVPRRVVAVVYERYRAKQPPKPPPRFPVEAEPERGGEVDEKALEKRRERLREDAEKKLRQQLPGEGDFETVRPE